jgi:hypothetical protein
MRALRVLVCVAVTTGACGSDSGGATSSTNGDGSIGTGGSGASTGDGASDSGQGGTTGSSAGPTDGSSSSNSDSGDGAAPADGGSDVSLDSGDANTGSPFGHCAPTRRDCPSGSFCVEGCPHGFGNNIPNQGGICSVPGRESCGCGAISQPCTTPGLHCLRPSCCDFPGLCVTVAEENAICAGPDAVRFACGSQSDVP